MKERKPSALRRLLKRLVVLAVLLVLAGLLAFWGLGLYLEDELPAIQSVADYRRTALQTTRVLAADGAVVAELFVERRTLVHGEDLPRHVKQAAVAAEDADFYQHEGLDFPGMLRALWVNLRDGQLSQGGSTITQQVARTFYLTAEKTLERKLLEVFLARKLDRHLGKDDILDLYLNQIYFGHGRYGIEEAARYYLGKPARALSAGEAALLMALVPAPERLNPFTDLEACLTRRKRILADMLRLGFIDAAAWDIAQREMPTLADPKAGPAGGGAWFVDAVRRQLEPVLGRERLLSGGLSVHTTLRADAQAAAEAAVAALAERGGVDPPEVAVVVMDPASREVLALVGGTDFQRSPYNRAVQARRQAGSTFKPFVFGAGLESGALTPATRYENRRICFGGAGRAWCPHNADGRYDGAAVTLTDALARSLNVVAVQALRDVGIARLTDFARRAGIASAIPADLTAALGSTEVSPLEITNAYATFASGGLAGRPVLVRRVEDPEGTYLYGETPQKVRAMEAAVADGVTAMLEAAVARGTGRAAQVPGLSVAGKTGTTSDQVDAWFVGYADHYLAAVWVGHDRPRPLGGTGGVLAAPIFRDVLARLAGRATTAASAAAGAAR